MMIGENAPKEPAAKATDRDGRSYAPPDNSAEIYAAIAQTPAGFFISVWSLKANVWVRLLNRYLTREVALAQIETYGWTYWNMAVPPHARDLRRERRGL